MEEARLQSDIRDHRLCVNVIDGCGPAFNSLTISLRGSTYQSEKLSKYGR